MTRLEKMVVLIVTLLVGAALLNHLLKDNEAPPTTSTRGGTPQAGFDKGQGPDHRDADASSRPSLRAASQNLKPQAMETDHAEKAGIEGHEQRQAELPASAE